MNRELQELFSKAGNMISQLGRYNSNNNEEQAGKALRDIRKYINDFFDSNVCIPKGENRHKYADYLHMLAEDPDSIVFRGDLGSQRIEDFVPSDNLNGLVFTLSEYVKPSKPVYEWQWYYIENGEGINVGWMTYDEASAKHDDIYNEKNYYIMQETKRVRR